MKGNCLNKKYFYIAGSAIALALSFAPFGLWPLAFIALVPFYYALDGATRRDSFRYGWAFGFVFFVATLYWVIHSMYFYGGIPFFLGFILMLLLCAGLGLYFALYGYFYSYGAGLTAQKKIVLASTLWVTMEIIRAHFLTGFTWVTLGYSQKPFLYFIQIADITGVYGISFAIVMVNMTICNFILNDRLNLSDGKAIAVKNAMPAISIILFIIMYGGVRVGSVNKDMAGWKKVNMAVLQGNIDQAVKWDPAFKESTVDIYTRLTAKAAKEGAEVVVWPEAATPFLFELTDDTKLQSKVHKAAIDNGVNIILGSPHARLGDDSNPEYLNSAFLLDPYGVVTHRYDKMHLVPLGEYVPFRLNEVFPFIQKLTVGVGDFGEGEDAVTLDFNLNKNKSYTPYGPSYGKAGVAICYEIIFPEISREAMKNGANILVTITNDAWFGRLGAPYQHFDMAVFRAVENRSYLARSANTGISGFVDPVGRVLAETDLFTEERVTMPVGIKEGSLTFYTLYGDIFAYLCIILSGFLLYRRNTSI